MKSLYIESTLSSPEVDFNAETNDLKLAGRSILTNVQNFYDPIMNWLEDLANNPPDKLNFTFDLNYYNLASAKRFMFMIYLLSKMKYKGCDLSITWKFVQDDDFMREFGEDLAENFQIPMALVPSKEYRPPVKLAC